MNRKNGFTLVEILAVISLLAILGIVSGVSVFNIIKKQKDTLASEQAKGLQDAAITYVISKKSMLDDCPTNFNPTSPSPPSCYRQVKVEELIRQGIFENKNGICDANATIIVYQMKVGSSSELLSYVPVGVCEY